MTTENGGTPASIDLGGDKSAGDQSHQQTGGSNSGGNSNGGGAESILAALSPENKAYFEKKGWGDLNKAFDSHRSLESAFSSRSPNNGNQQQQQQQQTPLVPANPSDYQFKLPDGIKENDARYDKAFADAFKRFAHSRKLSVEQAQGIHDDYVSMYLERSAAAQTDQQKALNDRIAATHTELTKAWGGVDTPQFKQNLEYAKRALSHSDPELKAALASIGVISKGADGKETITNAPVFRALAKMGSKLYAEDSLFGEKQQAENPFDPKKPNMTRQGELVKSDPELAKTLIRAAGVEQHWGHFLNKR